MQQSRGSIGHSKHRKAFGHKFPKSGLTMIRLNKMRAVEEEALIASRRRKKLKMFGSMSELMTDKRT